MVAQLVQALYNIVDSLFIGHYSPDGLTALVLMPVDSSMGISHLLSSILLSFP